MAQRLARRVLRKAPSSLLASARAETTLTLSAADYESSAITQSRAYYRPTRQ
jgi:hypothetical protein